MKQMTDELLLSAYRKATRLQNIDPAFLLLLEEEIMRRGLKKRLKT
ncbi:sporulation histidine kinase inhibitor Sda [Bacillus sp. FJAT-50079]|nr:sporulation histidine kinase inhibitor Sda [Bacillus sp. FJAT-50079]MBS4208911.1 sporulation histidine kinase inhibitor Sda [Bacillus sp. FJAT-50079]